MAWESAARINKVETGLFLIAKKTPYFECVRTDTPPSAPHPTPLTGNASDVSTEPAEMVLLARELVPGRADCQL